MKISYLYLYDKIESNDFIDYDVSDVGQWTHKRYPNQRVMVPDLLSTSCVSSSLLRRFVRNIISQNNLRVVITSMWYIIDTYIQITSSQPPKYCRHIRLFNSIFSSPNISALYRSGYLLMDQNRWHRCLLWRRSQAGGKDTRTIKKTDHDRSSDREM